MQTDRYHDRRDAGALLATELRDYAGPRTVVLGLARGGVPVAAEVAARLGLPLDVMLVRRLVDENDPETSYGAIALGGIVVLQNDVLAELALDDAAVKREVGLQQLALDRAEFTYRGDRAGLLIARRRVILVDDGLRSGSSMWAALEAARARQPTEIIVSAPVGSADAVERLESLADRVVCPRIVADGEPIRSAYSSYPLVTDDEVCALIRGADASSATV